MHKTRVLVDQMLSEGKIEEAEDYMEERREFLWEHGYHIRRLNQAYFAFYGSYAAQAGGAVSGSTNTLGNNIRKLRGELPSFAANSGESPLDPQFWGSQQQVFPQSWGAGGRLRKPYSIYKTSHKVRSYDKTTQFIY